MYSHDWLAKALAGNVHFEPFFDIPRLYERWQRMALMLFGRATRDGKDGTMG